jgi:hypothetical protein
MMLDEHMTPRCFWNDAIGTTCYISNQIFMCSILNLTPFELCFGCKLYVSKFESHSSDGILLGYTPHDRSYRVFNGDEDEPLHPSTSSPELVPPFTFEAEAP